MYAECDTHCTPVEVEDNISVTVRYANGAIGSIDALSCARGKESFGKRLYGTEGQIQFAWPLRVFTTRADIPGLKANAWNSIELPGQQWGPESRQIFFRRFAESIRDGASSCDIPGAAARKSLAFCVAAYESARTHAPVELA